MFSKELNGKSQIKPYNITHKHNGFTLIELLVVIAIIGLLLSIILPALKKVKEVSRKTICKTNFRSIHMAMVMYAEDNNDHITDPRGSTRDTEDPLVMWEENYYQRWCRKWYLRFYPYLDTPEVYVCPSWREKDYPTIRHVEFEVGEDVFAVTYTANEYVFSLYNREKDAPYEWKYTELVTKAVANNPIAILFSDGVYEVNGWGNWRPIEMFPRAAVGEMPQGRASYRHGGQANFLCADGTIGSLEMKEVYSWPNHGRYEDFRPLILK